MDLVLLLGLLAGLALPGVGAAVAQGVCSIAGNANLADNLFNFPTFSPTDAISLSWTSITPDNKLRLTTEQTNGGLIGYAWHNVQERIADGFVSTFTFSIAQPASNLPGDGFTYFVQNDKIVDLNGGTGANLGVYGIPRSIAVKFDICVDRPGECTLQEATVVVADQYLNYSYPLGGPVLLANSSLSVPPVANLTDGLPHKVVCSYSGHAFGTGGYMLISLDSIQLFNITVGDLTDPSMLNGRFAWFGFAASTSWSNTAEIDILSWRVDIQPSNTAIAEYSATKPVSVPYGTTAKVTLIFRDSCLNQVPITQTNTSFITATLLQEPAPGTPSYDYIILDANFSNSENGSFVLEFNLPDHYVGLYDLDVSVDGVRAENMPWVGAISTYVPPPPSYSLPIWALVLLLLLILLIIIVLSYIVYRLHRYRKKLKENEEFIEEGKKQAELDRLEDGLAYSANPLVGTVDDLKAQLEKNEAELARLRDRQKLGDDQDFTIEQLQAQRDALAAEMKRLKTEEQEAEIRRQGNTHVEVGGRTKKEFGREQL